MFSYWVSFQFQEFKGARSGFADREIRAKEKIAAKDIPDVKAACATALPFSAVIVIMNLTLLGEV